MSRRLVVPKSSLHLILTALEGRGYLQKNVHTRRYRFGLKLINLGGTALSNLELRDEAKPFLENLMRGTELTAHMAVLDRNQAVIVEKIEAPGLIRIATWIGGQLPLHCTALGKALLAFLPDHEMERRIRTSGPKRHNNRTIVSINALKQELAKVRRLGYSIDDEEDEIGCRCIGAPVFDSTRTVVATVSVSGTTSQIPVDGMDTLGTLVKHTAASISSYTGYGGPIFRSGG